MEEIDCLIYYKGEGNLEAYNQMLEDLCFMPTRKLRFQTLDYQAGRYRYIGDDYNADKIEAESLDNNLRIEILKKYEKLFP